jgi:hypothetical protein
MAAFIGAAFREARNAPHIRHAVGRFKRADLPRSRAAEPGYFVVGEDQAIAVALPRNISA